MKNWINKTILIKTANRYLGKVFLKFFKKMGVEDLLTLSSKERDLLRHARFKNRRELILYLDKNNTKFVAEVGVREGYFSKFILDNTSVEKLYAIDPWERNPELEHGAQEAFDTCHRLLHQFGKRAEMIKDYSPSAAEIFEDEILDFVYIDGLHDYESVKADIKAFYPKIKKGGIIAGHDYHKGDWPGVYDAVNEFTTINNLELNLTGIKSPDYEIENDGQKPTWWAYKK